MKQLEIDAMQSVNSTNGNVPETKGSLKKSQVAPMSGAKSADVPAETAAESRPVESVKKDSARIFFPCNREDALVFLGSLCISRVFPDSKVILPIQPSGVAVIDSGVRASEELLLNDGVAERFVVLVELTQEVLQMEPRTIGPEQISGLRFKSQKEADDFRFRPVDEFDTETYQCTVDPGLFGLDGDARFSVRSKTEPDILRTGEIADRIVSGISSLLELGSSRPVCRDAIVGILLGEKTGFDFNIVSTLQHLCGGGSDSPLSRQARAIVDAFSNIHRPDARSLIDGIAGNLSERSEMDERTLRGEQKWAEFARDVIRNKAVLDGEQTADAGSIALRAALLGALTNDTDALCAFLDAEKPSGPGVTALAAFFVGLKRGVIDTSWKRKRNNVRGISNLLANVVRMLSKQPRVISKPYDVSIEEQASTSSTEIRLGEVSLAKWETKKTFPPDAVDEQWMANFVHLGYEVIGAGSLKYSWIVRLSEKYTVEVVRREFGEKTFPIFVFRLPEGEKLKKAKDLAEFSKTAGTFWNLVNDPVQGAVFQCNLMSLPNADERKFLVDKLNECLLLCAVPKRAKVAKRKKPIVKNG